MGNFSRVPNEPSHDDEVTGDRSAMNVIDPTVYGMPPAKRTEADYDHRAAVAGDLSVHAL